MSLQNLDVSTVSWIAIVVLSVIGLFVVVSRRVTHRDRGPGSSDALTVVFVLIPFVLILGLGAILAAKVFSKEPEIQVGFLVVIGVIALITLLFIVAAGFAHLQLADAKQALALPEGRSVP